MGVTQQTRQKQNSDSGLLAAGPGSPWFPAFPSPLTMPYATQNARASPQPSRLSPSPPDL